MRTKPFQTLLSFLHKRQFFLFIFLAYTSVSYAFDSHEHVYLGECISLQYEGDDSAYKRDSGYKDKYTDIQKHGNLVGNLCNKALEKVSLVKLNRFNFKNHETLENLKDFKTFRNDRLWHKLPYTKEGKNIPLFRIKSNGKLVAFDSNHFKQLAAAETKDKERSKEKWKGPLSKGGNGESGGDETNRTAFFYEMFIEKEIEKEEIKKSIYNASHDLFLNSDGKKIEAPDGIRNFRLLILMKGQANVNWFNDSADRNNIPAEFAVILPPENTLSGATNKDKFINFRLDTFESLWKYFGQGRYPQDSLKNDAKYFAMIFESSKTVEEDSWSIGEIISIAGDYVGLPKSDHPTPSKEKAPAISDPLFEPLAAGKTMDEQELLERAERVAQNVLKAFNYLKWWPGNPFSHSGDENKTLDTWFRELVKKELKAVSDIHEATKTKVTFDSSSHREKYVTGKRAQHQVAAQLKVKTYDNMALLSANVDHFAPDAQYVYQIGHNLACSFAMAARRSYTDTNDAQVSNRILSEAYGIEAFVSHYLSDLFSAGHVRAPRRAFKELRQQGKSENENWYEGGMDIAGNLVHDVDGWLGLKVCNGPSCGNEWVSYGDNSLFDVKSQENREKAVETLQAGFDQIWDCYNVAL